MDVNAEVRYPRTIQFQTGRILVINATASLADDGHHPNVLTATLPPSSLFRPSSLYEALVAIVCRLPSCLQALLRDYWPILFLPQRFILKKMKKDSKDEFENEKAIYAHLKDLQGDLIPTFYGEVEFEGSTALAISYVDGQKLSDTDLTLEQVQRLAEDAFLPLQERGVVPDDMKLDNFILVGNRLVLIDLEHVDKPCVSGELSETAQDAVHMLLSYYNSKLRDAKLDW